jgi:hypothetical protein
MPEIREIELIKRVGKYEMCRVILLNVKYCCYNFATINIVKELI